MSVCGNRLFPVEEDIFLELIKLKVNKKNMSKTFYVNVKDSHLQAKMAQMKDKEPMIGRALRKA